MGSLRRNKHRKCFPRRAFDVLITDNNLPGKSGLDLLEETLSRYPEIVGIVITGFGTIETAVQAIKKGAYDYLSKPFKLVELSIMVRKGLKERTLRFENQYLRSQLKNKYAFDNIIGTGRSMARIFELIDSVAGLNSTVLIQGETGTGKELIAKAIHFNSPRKDQKMVSINCGAIPENLLGVRIVRPREGSVYRRRAEPHRPIRTRQQRNDLPGRNRKHAAVAAGEVAARAAGARIRARRRKQTVSKSTSGSLRPPVRTWNRW